MLLQHEACRSAAYLRPRRAREKPLGLVGGLIVLGFFLVGVFADVLAPGGQMGMDRANGLLGLTRIYMEGPRCWHSGRACA